MNYASICRFVTDKIIDEMSKGIIPWTKPWFGVRTGAVSYNTGKPYSFLNQMLLGGEGGEWITFNKCKELGGRIKCGSKHRPIIKLIVDKETDDNGDEQLIKYYRIYQMFRVGVDTTGIELKWKDPLPESILMPDVRAENVVTKYLNNNNTLTILRDKGSNDAYYSPSNDSIVVPMLEQYPNISEYYSTLYHEMTHSTGHKSRLDRLTDDKFGDENYSKEELVAELGSASLLNYVGLSTAGCIKNSAAYVQSWMKRLKEDPKLIVNASKDAEKAMAYILGIEMEVK